METKRCQFWVPCNGPHPCKCCRPSIILAALALAVVMTGCSARNGTTPVAVPKTETTAIPSITPVEQETQRVCFATGDSLTCIQRRHLPGGVSKVELISVPLPKLTE